MDGNKIIIGVCGDSFSAACTEELITVGRRAHFSQILEDRYGYTVYPFAHGAFSNTGILFQMQEAFNRNVDVIVYNKSWSSRLEIRLNQFYPEQGLKNFVYFSKHHPSTYRLWAGDENSAILSTVPQGIEKHTFLTKEHLDAVKYYFSYIFDYDLNKIRDEWLFEFWHNKIKQAGIHPICFNDEDIGKIAYDFSEANQTFDAPFHTDRATQEVIAENIHRNIVDNVVRKS